MGVKTNENIAIAQNSTGGAKIFEYKANGGETLITLPEGFGYTVGKDQIKVEIEGCPLYVTEGEFTETDSKTITFETPLTKGEHVTVFLRK